MFRSVLRFVLVIGFLNEINAAPRRKLNIDPVYLKAMMAYKKLEPKMTRQELTTITTVGILNGALKAEKDMEKHLTTLVTDLILNTDMSDKSATLPKIIKIEETIERDKNVIRILSSAMDLATKSLTVRDYNMELKKTLEEHMSKKRETSNIKDIDMGKLKTEILDHIRSMHNNIIHKIDSTLDYLKKTKELDMIKGNKKRDTDEENRLQTLFDEDKVENNVVDLSEKSVNASTVVFPNDVVEIGENNGNKTASQLEESDEDDDDDGNDGGGPGGLLGVIASLSGGEGGSDIGALVGALTGVIAQIFGPDGLDIETLLATSTSLISGLLAGDRNFGTVLGEYVGIAFDGLSGGGGADKNGKFIGNFLGTVVASLSADPEEDDLPPQPMVFLQSLIKSFSAAKNRAGNGEGDEEGEKPTHPQMGSDSIGFVKQITSALVGGITSLILNASVGASGGSSQASTSALTSSSHPQPHPHPHKPTW